MKAGKPVSNRLLNLNELYIVLLLCALGGLFPFTSLQATAAPLPSFPDPALQACFDEQAQARNWQSAEDVDQLLCPNRGISDAAGVDQLPNLVELDLSDNPLEMVGPVYELQGTLQRLNLSDTKLCDLGEVLGLTGLQRLQLNEIDFSCPVDASELEQDLNYLLMDNPDLTHVGFNGYSISDPYELFNNFSPALVSLELSGTGLTEVPVPLDQFEQIEALDLSDNPLEMVGPVYELQGTLQRLNLSDTKLCDLSEVLGLTGLERLRLNDIEFHCPVDSNQLEQELSALLLDNPGLTHVGFNGYRISDPYELFNNFSPALVSLELSGAGLMDIPVPLEQFTQLEVVDLSGNPLEMLGPIQGLQGTLQRLNLSGTKLCDLGKLLGFTGLERLRLNDIDFSCPVDASQLEQDLNALLLDNPDLTHVGFNGYSISDPYELFNNLSPGLISLELSEVGLTDIPISLEQFQQLETLDLSDNPLGYLGSIQGQPKTLQRLNLSGTKLCDLGDLFGLTGLERLWLNDIDFSCPISSNQLEQDLNYLLMDNPDLTHVGLNGFNISDPYELFNNLSSALVSLELSGTGLTEVPVPLDQFAQLKRLDLSDNDLGLLGPLNGAALTLEKLNLSNTYLPDISELSSLQDLTHLYLNHEQPVTYDTQAVREILENNTALAHVGLSGIQFQGDSGIIYDALGALPVVRLEIANTGVANLYMPLNVIERLEDLDAESNAVIDSSVHYDAGNLAYLKLVGNDIVSVESLTGGLSSIEFLSLLGNNDIPCPELDDLEASFNSDTQLIRPLSCQDAPPPSMEYCEAGGDSTSFEWIDGVGLGATFYQSGNNNGYSDNSPVVFDLIKGAYSTIQLTPGFSSGSFSEHWGVWIDFDNNGQFEVGERIVSQQSSSNVAVDFAVPVTAETQVVRMRVAMRYGGAPEACGSFSWGEVEDYSVSISE
jgi:Leucine-rich repeat (LRR) protein